MNSSQVQYRNSRSHIFFEIDVLENFTIFTRKQLCWSLFLMAFSSATLLKRDSNTGAYLWILKNVKELLFADHFRWLLLTIMYLVNVMFYWVNSWNCMKVTMGVVIVWILSSPPSQPQFTHPNLKHSLALRQLFPDFCKT